MITSFMTAPIIKVFDVVRIIQNDGGRKKRLFTCSRIFKIIHADHRENDVMFHDDDEVLLIFHSLKKSLNYLNNNACETTAFIANH